MSMLIRVKDCIDCSLCIPACPDGGISIIQEVVGQYEHYIDPNKCTECIEFNRDSKCFNICPTECIDNKDTAEPDDVLWNRKRMHEKNKCSEKTT